MKLVKTYNLPGSSIKIYQEAGEVSARLTMQLIQHSSNKTKAMAGLSKQLIKLNEAMQSLPEIIHANNHCGDMEDEPVSNDVLQIKAPSKIVKMKESIKTKKELEQEARRLAWKTTHAPQIEESNGIVEGDPYRV